MSSLVITSKGELYSAMAGLEALIETQKAIVDRLDFYIEESEKKVKNLKRLKDDYNILLNISTNEFQEFISNPINAFVLIKKLSVDWNETTRSHYYIPLNEGANSETVIFPDYEDLSGAAKALLRVQQTYDLDTLAISEGKIAGAPKGLTLSAHDCFELGRQAYYAGYFDYAISWLKRAQNKSEEEGQREENEEIMHYLTLATYEKGKNSLMVFTSSLLQLGKIISSEKNTLSSYFDLEQADSNTEFTSHTNMVDETVYQKLCQAKKDNTPMTPAADLKCRLLTPHSYFVLQPVKEEELWINPKVSLFYEVISDKEIEIMKLLALPELQRAEVAEYRGSLGHRVSDTRVTKVAWLGRKNHSLIPKLYRRIEDITGLSSESAEPFQMANYGLGGHFHLHMDVLPDTESYYGPDLGNRIATWLTYLSDVQSGGATVFPRLNLIVWPKKGSALFWHNVKSNGVGNIFTLHGACPVISGSKWITNVWFHERSQEFLLKCGKYPDSPLEPTKRMKSFLKK